MTENLLPHRKFKIENSYTVLFLIAAFGAVIFFFSGTHSDSPETWGLMGCSLLAGLLWILNSVRGLRSIRTRLLLSEAKIKVVKASLKRGETSTLEVSLMSKKPAVIKAVKINLAVVAAKQNSIPDSIQLAEGQALVTGVPCRLDWTFTIPEKGPVSSDGQGKETMVGWALDYTIQFEKPSITLEGTIPLDIQS